MVLEDTGVNTGAKIPSSMRKFLIEAVQDGQYISISDFVRDAIKEKLYRAGYYQKKFGHED